MLSNFHHYIKALNNEILRRNINVNYNKKFYYFEYLLVLSVCLSYPVTSVRIFQKKNSSNKFVVL